MSKAAEAGLVAARRLKFLLSNGYSLSAAPPGCVRLSTPSS
jgi:hypothetical protein